MPSYLPYLILALVSLAVLSAAVYRERCTALIAITLAHSGMIYTVEYVIFLILDCYRYAVGVWPGRYEDNVLGAIASNLLALPTAATLLAVYRARIRVLAGVTLLYAAIEWLFIRLGVYELHWWRIPYTIVSLLLFFLLARKGTAALLRGRRFTLWVYLFMFAWSLVGTLVFLMSVLGLRMNRLGVFEDVHRDDIFAGATYAIVKAAFLVLFVMRTDDVRLRLLPVVLLLGFNAFLIRIGVIQVFIPLWCYFLIYTACCLIVLGMIALARGKLADPRGLT